MAKLKSNAASVLVKKQGKQFNAMLKKQNQQADKNFTLYKNQIAGQEKLQDVYSRLQGEAGLPQLQQGIGTINSEIGNVKGYLDNLTGDINSRTRGTFTTEAQARRLESSERGVLQDRLGRLAAGAEPLVQQFGLASQNLGTALSATQQQQEKELDPRRMKINSLTDRFAREITGFTQNKQNELTSLVDRLQRQQYLADREWERVQQLAAEEREFSRQRQLAASSATSYQDKINQLLNGRGGGNGGGKSLDQILGRASKRDIMKTAAARANAESIAAQKERQKLDNSILGRINNFIGRLF